MSEFHLYCPIQIRYSDVDAQAHVNNVRFLSYFEQARMQYLVELGLWDGKAFLDLGLIVADVHVTYHAPLYLGQEIRVGIRVSRLGNKSLDFAYQIEDQQSGKVAASCETVMVAYDYHTNNSIPIPPRWREKITAFEEMA